MMTIVGVALNLLVATPLLVTGLLEASEQTCTLLYSTMALSAVTGALATVRHHVTEKSRLTRAMAPFGDGCSYWVWLRTYGPPTWVC